MIMSHVHLAEAFRPRESRGQNRSTPCCRKLTPSVHSGDRTHLSFALSRVRSRGEPTYKQVAVGSRQSVGDCTGGWGLDELTSIVSHQGPTSSPGRRPGPPPYKGARPERGQPADGRLAAGGGGWLAASGGWLAGGWLVVGWWVVGG